MRFLRCDCGRTVAVVKAKPHALHFGATVDGSFSRTLVSEDTSDAHRLNEYQ